MAKKKFAYQVVRSTYPQVKVGSLLAYDRGRGPTHSEVVMDFNTGEPCGTFAMEKVGPCWSVNGKVQFEEPPAKSGDLTKGIMAAVRKRGRDLRRTK